jgi:topoisomerase IV subunit A
VLLSELEQGTVDWVPELRRHPGRAEGAAGAPAQRAAQRHHRHRRGHGHRHPPHNLREVAAPASPAGGTRATVDELCEHIQGPDFPTEAEIITPRAELRRCTRPATARCACARVYEREDGDIVVTALPTRSRGAKVLEQIAAQMQAKKLPMVEDLRDESDHEHPTRLVIIPRSNRVDVDELMTTCSPPPTWSAATGST